MSNEQANEMIKLLKMQIDILSNIYKLLNQSNDDYLTEVTTDAKSIKFD